MMQLRSNNLSAGACMKPLISTCESSLTAATDSGLGKSYAAGGNWSWEEFPRPGEFRSSRQFPVLRIAGNTVFMILKGRKLHHLN